MSIIAFEFKLDWLMVIEKRHEKAIECLIKAAEAVGGEITSKSQNGFKVKGEADQRKMIIDAVVGYIVEKDWVLNPFDNLTIGGDVSGLEEYIKQLEKDLEKHKEEEIDKIFQDILEKEENKSATKDPLEASAEEQETSQSIEDMLAMTINNICNKIPEKYSPIMVKCLKEFATVIPMLKDMGMEANIWSRNLLVAIDPGYGYGMFLNDIVEILQKSELLVPTGCRRIQEIEVKQSDKVEDKYRGWDKLVSRVESIGSENRNGKHTAILSIDIREWVSELQTERVATYLRRIGSYAGSVICVFRVPFVEASVLHRMAERLEDVMPIQAFSIPCISMEHMIEFLQERLVEAGFTVEEGSLAYFEQWVMKERCDDSFYGYETLVKMIQELIYKKALLNCERGEVSYTITEEDMLALLEEPYVETDPYKLLNDLIGISSIKQYVKELVVQIKTQKEFADGGKIIDRPCIHMMFTGNPGTGKTTVARILARILKEEGVLRKGLFFEIHGRSLCGSYVGHTAPKTSAICRDAYGSVLFIDEAYSLHVEDSDRDFGREAIHTLIAEMENHRDDFCVILAGYKKELHKMFKANSGLESRIAYEIEFPNYTREELEDIFFAMMNGKFEYSDSLREVVHQFFETLPDTMLDSEEFSNARFVRNIYERVWGKAAYRRNMEGGDKIIIEKVDFDNAVETMDIKTAEEEKTKRRIGFY